MVHCMAVDPDNVFHRLVLFSLAYPHRAKAFPAASYTKRMISPNAAFVQYADYLEVPYYVISAKRKAY